MRTRVEPAIDRWRLGSGPEPQRQGLAALAERHVRLGGAELQRVDRIVATGHQASLWHPGILAKDLAMVAAGQRLDAAACHVVVDQDVQDAWSLDLPTCAGGRLGVRRIRLAPVRSAVPAAAQAPADAERVADRLRGVAEELGDTLAADIGPLLDAVRNLPRTRTLAEQMGAVTAGLMRPYTGPVPIVAASDLLRLPAGVAAVGRMLFDARRCARAYNRAVSSDPRAGVPPLGVCLERVELPLWRLAWNEPRRRVYADVTDATPLLIDETGRELNWPDDPRVSLAPRALMLTALMRSTLCDLFIHGTGGGRYDRLTEAWWGQWQDRSLCPMAVVSADARMEFGVRTGDRAAVTRARWYRHHLPHNVDRVLKLHPGQWPLASRKAALLRELEAGGDRAQRRRAFAELHAINERLAFHHPRAMREAEERMESAVTALGNARVAARRDWAFALYPPHRLRSLNEEFRRQAGVGSASPVGGS